MHGFLDILIKVGSEWTSWIAIGILACWAGFSFFRKTVCPIANPGRNIIKANLPGPEEAHADLQRRIRHPFSFPMFMFLGIALALAGLFGLANGDGRGTLAFFTLAVGLFVVLTFPVRFQIKEAELRVLSTTEPEHRSALAYDLRLTHWRLLQYEFGILALLTTIIVAF